MSDRQPPKEYRGHFAVPPELTYADKLRDVRWKRRRDDLLRRSHWTCCECGTLLAEGEMDL